MTHAEHFLLKQAYDVLQKEFYRDDLYTGPAALVFLDAAQLILHIMEHAKLREEEAAA